MTALWIEEHDEDGAHWIVSLSGQPNPEPEDAVECVSREDAARLVAHLRTVEEAGRG